jgi:hypothetical protein
MLSHYQGGLDGVLTNARARPTGRKRESHPSAALAPYKVQRRCAYVNDIPSPIEGKLEALIRQVSTRSINRVDPAERVKIAALETGSVSMARLLSEQFANLAQFAELAPVAAAVQLAQSAHNLEELKKARAVWKVKGPGGAPAIESFEQALYHFAISFGELCKRTKREFTEAELRQVGIKPAHAALRAKKAPVQEIIDRRAQAHWERRPENRTEWGVTARVIWPEVKSAIADANLAGDWARIDDKHARDRIRKNLEATGKQQSSKENSNLPK